MLYNIACSLKYLVRLQKKKKLKKTKTNLLEAVRDI